VVGALALRDAPLDPRDEFVRLYPASPCRVPRYAVSTSPAFTTVVCAALRVQLQNRRPDVLDADRHRRRGVAIAGLAGVLDVSSLDSSWSRREDVIETAAGLVLLAG
jgi:hypothetical protein